MISTSFLTHKFTLFFYRTIKYCKNGITEHQSILINQYIKYSELSCWCPRRNIGGKVESITPFGARTLLLDSCMNANNCWRSLAALSLGSSSFSSNSCRNLFLKKFFQLIKILISFIKFWLSIILPGGHVQDLKNAIHKACIALINEPLIGYLRHNVITGRIQTFQIPISSFIT